MIRVVMLGRLGNNLFQYAFGRVLAEKYNVPLVLDASWFNGRTWPFVESLRRLPGVVEGKATVVRPFSLGSRVLKKLTKKHHWEFFRAPLVKEEEDDHSFDPRLLESQRDCVVFGYFQTPRYFACIEDSLRRELSTENMNLEVGHEHLAKKLRTPSSVAVHIRRTDYVQHPCLTSLDRDYYQRAMDRMREDIGSPRFFVFSDDPQWCAKAFADPDVEVMDHCDPFAPLVDLHLMSLAGNHIIANSSYSWWAAWLGKKPDQRVLMPDSWFSKCIHAPIGEKLVDSWALMPTADSTV